MAEMNQSEPLKKRNDRVVEWFHMMREEYSKLGTAFAKGVADYFDSYWGVYQSHGSLAAARAYALMAVPMNHRFGEPGEIDVDEWSEFHAGLAAADRMVTVRIDAGQIVETETPRDYDGGIWNASAGYGTPYGAN